MNPDIGKMIQAIRSLGNEETLRRIIGDYGCNSFSPSTCFIFPDHEFGKIEVTANCAKCRGAVVFRYNTQPEKGDDAIQEFNLPNSCPNYRI